MKKEYIEKRAVEDMLENAHLISEGEYCGYCTEDIDINSIPVADVAPVVRCKDCNYYVDGCCIIHSEDPDVFSPGYSFNPEPNDFCSYGWRRGTPR